jgi:hypothetical protein
MDRPEFKKIFMVQDEAINSVVFKQTTGTDICTKPGRRRIYSTKEHYRMTNREYHNKQHRGSSPLSNTISGATEEICVRLPSEEWKELTWYPVSSSPLSRMKGDRTRRHNGQTDDT